MSFENMNNNEIIDIKQLLSVSINKNYFEPIKNIIDKNVKQCSYLYTQVCYLIKLFLLCDFEKNKNNNDYVFNELFIRFCFKLIRSTKSNNDEKDNDLQDIDKNNIKNRLTDFLTKYNSEKETNKFKFNCPDDLSSITHITNALSIDIKTNILNNITINYFKYIKEYIKININIDFKDAKIEITDFIINNIYNDIIFGSLNSNIIFHNWISKHKHLIIPLNNNIVSIINLEDGIKKHYECLSKFIKNYINNDNALNDLIKLYEINDKKIILNSIYNDLIKNEFNTDDKFHYWIKENKIIIINEFNKKNYIDLNKEIKLKPYSFIPLMLFMNKNLELNNSKKKYQIIPLRTNLMPKFIPINIHSLVDILDSKFLFNKNKNYYHDDTKKGFVLFETYFNFKSDFILKTIKKGYVFSGLIKTNGYEIIFSFISKQKKEEKDNFHLKGKLEKKFIKDSTKGMNLEEKNNFLIQNKNNKNEKKKEITEEIIKKSKENKNKEKESNKNKKSKIENELKLIVDLYEDKLKLLSEQHKQNLKNELSKLDKGKEEYKNIMNEIIKTYNEKLKSEKAFINHCFKRDYDSFVDDYENDVDLKYNKILDEEKINDEKIKKLKLEILKTKKEIKILKKEQLKFDKKKYVKLKDINSKLNKNKLYNIKLKRTLTKINKYNELLNYETENKMLVRDQIKNIKLKLINLILKIYKKNKFFKLNEYLNQLTENKIDKLENIILNKKALEANLIFKFCIMTISLNLSDYKNKDFKLKLEKENLNYKKQIEKKQSETKEYKKKYSFFIESLEKKSKELNLLLKIKNKNENELMNLFKTKNNEYMIIDNMSKKYLSIVNKLNYVLIDPGINSLFTMMSKDGKKCLSFSKSKYINRTKRIKIMKKIENIKKIKIKKLEDELTKENKRLKTTNDYKNFNVYFQLKMNLHERLTELYNDIRLNKLKWYLFINEKRSENLLVNDIKKKFGNDVVLILGDWSMDKSGIKTISTPNKKYEKVLIKNFLTLKINEFRTSKLHYESEKVLENHIKKYDIKQMNIKSIYNLEKLKKKDKKKYKKAISDKKIHKILVCKTNPKFYDYVNRDINSVKNMRKIVSNLITKNHRPRNYVMGTQICNII